MAAGKGRFAEELAEPVELVVEPLPCWKGLGEEERRRAVRGWVEAVESEVRARDTPVLGARAVRAQHPHTRPEHLKRRRPRHWLLVTSPVQAGEPRPTSCSPPHPARIIPDPGGALAHDFVAEGHREVQERGR